MLQCLNKGEELYAIPRPGAKFSYQQFKGKLNPNVAAVMGHSYGGATTIQTLYSDERFKLVARMDMDLYLRPSYSLFRCGIALDCWMLPIHRDLRATGVKQPLLFINSWDFQWKENILQMMELTTPPDENGKKKPLH